MRKILSFSLFFLLSLGLALIIGILFQRLAWAYQAPSLLPIEQTGQSLTPSSDWDIVNSKDSTLAVIELSVPVSLSDEKNFSSNNLAEFTNTSLDQLGNLKKVDLKIDSLSKNIILDKNEEISSFDGVNNLGEIANFSGQRRWLVKNNSSVSGQLSFALQKVINLENGCNDQEKSVDPQCIQPGKEGDLGRIINLKIFFNGQERGQTTLENSQADKIKKDWSASPAIILKPHEQGVVTAYWEVNESSYGNEVQSDSVEFIISFQLSAVNKKNIELGPIAEPLSDEILESTVSSSLDTDNDSLSDIEEREVYQTNPFKSDTDGDGYYDNEEIKNGYDPNNSAKVKKNYLQ